MRALSSPDTPQGAYITTSRRTAHGDMMNTSPVFPLGRRAKVHIYLVLFNEKALRERTARLHLRHTLFLHLFVHNNNNPPCSIIVSRANYQPAPHPPSHENRYALTSPHFCCTGCLTLRMALEVMESFRRRVDSRALVAAYEEQQKTKTEQHGG